ncbi:hypothetical protein SH661x_002991 [Planctomicrobium sp. SH661]|uniref:hypothetical protein n=1 Tax=Planctomicrobium sp. SH661 TaxID=3448124 RepID=UPI003F5B39A3
MLSERGCRGISVTTALMCIIGLVGCGASQGPERASVSGEIRLNGEPLENGSLILSPAEGVVGPTSGATINNGKFEIPRTAGPVLGMHRIEITAMKEVKGKSTSDAPANEPVGPMSPGAEYVQVIPAQYNKKSTLSLNVQPGANRFDIDLKSSP